MIYKNVRSLVENRVNVAPLEKRISLSIWLIINIIDLFLLGNQDIHRGYAFSGEENLDSNEHLQN